ncbi:protein N-acetyltransferase-like protein [Haloferax elongans ATCC BAA-1513]|uniref:Protein N-acetyltransferase-like protein n=1 Tax=Haloferax elongans ATCC BAA-1513 TaxID=1230453 RepID=M0HBD9_HALEO|nr:GNAT family N-acetyltransferase [Haloferax elongans]ELZ81815.1 protein N-acetyltransferase-like protein [Haloferax elongans ATCC BAA-1513]
MPALWRLTRTETARRVYETLKSLGITGTQMDEYVTETAADRPNREPDAAIDIRALAPDDARPHEQTYDAFSELRDDEQAVCAFDGDDLVGYLFLGDPGLTYHVKPLEKRLHIPGGYIRRVFVDPAARNQGIATALVSRAVAEAENRDADTVHALVARDNRPSQWTFEANGFRVERTRSYYRIGPWNRRSVSENP